MLVLAAEIEDRSHRAAGELDAQIECDDEDADDGTGESDNGDGGSDDIAQNRAHESTLPRTFFRAACYVSAFAALL